MTLSQKGNNLASEQFRRTQIHVKGAIDPPKAKPQHPGDSHELSFIEKNRKRLSYIFKTPTICSKEPLSYKETPDGNLVVLGDSKTKGRILYKDGSAFEGDISDDMANGLGIFFNAKGQIAYKGEFEMDQFSGFGTQYNLQETKKVLDSNWKDTPSNMKEWISFEGHFECGKRKGEGVLEYADGSRLEGKFNGNEPEMGEEVHYVNLKGEKETYKNQGAFFLKAHNSKLVIN